MDEIAGTNLSYTDQTLLHPLALLAVVLLGCTLLMVPRKWAVLPIFIMACFISSAQRIAIAELDFNLLRIMVIFGLLRIYIKNEAAGFVWKRNDTIIICWSLSATLINTIQFGSFSALINRLGFSFDALGAYFVFRFLIRDWTDIESAIKGFIIVGVPVMLALMLEYSTKHNIFSVFGGVPAVTMVREGRLRCQGAFSHAILAGCFWAALMPMMVTGWWKNSEGKVWAVVGLVVCLANIVLSASSTPLMGAISAAIGAAMFFLRYQMKTVRWTLVAVLTCLHFILNRPVWGLIASVSAVGGSTGWHRYHLIDAAIHHFSEWCLFGITSTAHWGWGLQDVTNNYVLEAVRGGFLTLVLFVWIIVCAYQSVGRTWRACTPNPYRVAMAWGLGVSLFVHSMNFIGVSYFGQIFVIWYLLLAMIASMDPGKLKRIPSVQRRKRMADSRAQTPPASAKETRSEYQSAVLIK